MPGQAKKWDAEADAQLMAAVMQLCDVKLNQQQYGELAKVMECTPKAISHRISHYRNAGKHGTNSKPGNRATKTTDSKKSKKAARTPSPEVDGEEAGAAPTPPPSSRPKRNGSKRDYAQLAGEEDKDDDAAEEDGLNKKVKIEVGEDIGEGLRQTNYFEDAMADGDAFA